jgi:hypothetical protein
LIFKANGSNSKKIPCRWKGKRALKSIDYLGLIPVLMDLVKQQKEIDALKKAITK